MSDEIVIKAVSSAEIKNGSIVVSIGEVSSPDEFGAPASGYKIQPTVNQFVASGTHFSRLHQRFDEHYGGGAS